MSHELSRMAHDCNATLCLQRIIMNNNYMRYYMVNYMVIIC